MPANPQKAPTMYHRNNPFKPVPQRAERFDATWERRRDPIGYRVAERSDDAR